METRPSLYLNGDRQRVRRSDPLTSHDAADATSASRVAIENFVLKLFEQYGPMTDRELTNRYFAEPDAPPADPETPRKRRSGLTSNGVLVDSGVTRMMSSGRRATVWSIPAPLTDKPLFNI